MQTVAAVDQAPQPPAPDLDAIAIRMADEGVPLRAIARATQRPSDNLREVFRDAIDRGAILEMPVEDWPVTSNRGCRSPAAAAIQSMPDDTLSIYLSLLFKTTRLESTVLIALLKRPQVSKEQLHEFIESRRRNADDLSSIKMVDVVICKLRKKKLPPFDLHIDTVWGSGYMMPKDDRKRAVDMVLALVKSKEI